MLLLGWTPLFFAVQGTESLSVIRLLIDHGADQNKADNCGITPLHIAAERGSYEVAEFLLSKGAEVDPICKYGETPLHIAAENGDAKMVKLLLQHNADHGRLSCGFHTPLTMSLFGSSLECLEILIEAGADINADTHLSPLKIAAAQGLADCIECLLKAGAKANIPDELGRMPIEIAAFEGRVECVKILFPATTPLVKYANWSIDEIIRNGLTERLREGSKVKAEGDTAFRKKDYIFASTRYTLALTLVPNDSDLYAKRSLCYLRMGDKENALPDAITYRDMQQDLPKSSSEQGAALTLVLEYGREFEAFMSGLNLGSGSCPTDETDEASREEHP
ncbi:uncharacterized protein LOC133906337 [Phragmites australis]|uniref:uncharacterized protein LOC133906337 n=1 Tax=Phragmites australis TaxID=29695 RepID=UPI002D779754|nr:uncharacterized protein LOC133906337 [Phragmites australis]